MRVLLCLLLAAVSLSALEAHAERPPIAVSGGLGVRHFEDSGTELVAPLQVRLDVSKKWSLQLGEDIICSHPACALLGFYRTGMLFRPLEGRVSPYAYGYTAFFIHAAEPLDDQPRPYNVGLHWGAGAGVELDLSRQVAMYIEGGVLGDIGGDFVAPTATAGVLLRFGRGPSR